MEIAAWILVLCLVSGVTPKPSIKRNWFSANKLDGSFRQIRQNSDNCRELSETFGALIQYSPRILDFFVAIGQIPEAVHPLMLELASGFDIVNDNEAREQYTCAITQSRTLSELKQALEDNKLLPNVFRLAYDVISIVIRTVKSTAKNDPEIVSFISALESAGLTGLDHDRVQWLAEVAEMTPYMYYTNYTSAAPYPGPNSEKCNRLTTTFTEVVLEILSNIPAERNRLGPVLYIEGLTGLDILNRSVMTGLLCDLVDGASSGVQGLYDALNNHGVVAHLMKAGYPYAQINLPMIRGHLERMYNNYMSLPPPPVNDSDKQQNEPVSSQANPRAAPDPGPTSYKRGTESSGRNYRSGPEASELERRAELIRLTVDFLRALEDSNLLQLAIDV